MGFFKQQVERLIKKYPNDMELGKYVRDLFYNLPENYFKGKIYESPDNGKTIYERNVGESNRVNITEKNTTLKYDDDDDIKDFFTTL